MINVEVINKTSFKVNKSKLEKIVQETLEKNNIPTNAECSVVLVEHTEIVKMAMEFMNESKREAQDHPVLSFPNTELEGPFVFPPDSVVHVGEVVVSLKKAIEISESENISIDKAICDLAEHGTLHLAGVHHD